MEKQASQELERRRDQAFADRLLVTEQRVQMMERDVQRARKDAALSLQEYRDRMQQKHLSKEWDLNDPDTLRKDRPARMDDNDPSLGPASLQKFTGEDLDYGNRVRKQQQQQASWVRDQMSEKQAQIEDEIEAERLEAERQAELDERRAALEAEEMGARSAANGAVRDFNLALAEEKREREAERRYMDYEDKEEEIRNQLTSDLLTENRAATMSHAAPHRYLKYHFKGFSDEQVAGIRTDQLRQAAEKAERAAMEREDQQSYDLVQEAVRRNLVAGEREVLRRRQELARQTSEEQRRQAEEARARRAVLDNQVFAGAIDESFFKQFGTSSR